MQRKHWLLITIVGLTFLSANVVHDADDDFWGFFGHRLINKTAVFTLPVELIPLYKSNIDFVTEHAIDPDKRKFASPLEAVRHYIDLDIWGAYPFDNVPRDFTDAMLTFSSVHLIEKRSRDTVLSWKNDAIWDRLLSTSKRAQLEQEIKNNTYAFLDRGFLALPQTWVPDIYEQDEHEMILIEHFTEYGILPYHLETYQRRLTAAFKDRNWALAIRLSTEIGHYLSDGHVPLHTTENYNGQLTGQDGIHAFWESRIPELFATDNYDFFVGRAKYIEDTKTYFWDVILDSHSYVDEVLSKELELRNTFASDKQYCYQQRGAATSRLECEAYAKAYQDAMSGMVERQMRKSIQAVGSSWYTAWVDAGRPALDDSVVKTDMDSTVLMKVDTLAIQG